MTEQEWLECAEPMDMLALLPPDSDKRKLRLFAVACCRHIWHLLKHEAIRVAVESAEGFADKRGTKKKMMTARALARTAVGRMQSRESSSAANEAAIESANLDAAAAARRSADNSAVAASEAFFARGDFNPHRANELRRQHAHRAALLRCIFANPFRPVAAAPAWLTPTVVSLATAIYDDRAFDRLPILADALEDAGCNNADILNHCRQPGEHVRGCWVLDLVLAKG